MEQEVDLPPLPVLVPQDETPPTLSDLQPRRKRPRAEYDLTTSSDPALFSSDDRAPSADNYVSKRRKEQWRGTWWGEKVEGPSPSRANAGKRKFTRNIDSGVWMGSEGTDTSFEDEFLEDLRSGSNQATEPDLPSAIGEQVVAAKNNDGAIRAHIDEPELRERLSRQIREESTRRPSLCARVDAIIDRCLEVGDENVDLSTMSLDNVSNDSLRRLRSLTRHTTIQDIPPSQQDTYAPIEAALRLFLSNNAISTFPSAILNLSNLRALSLRNNKLTKIPANLAKLTHLETLHVGGNKLQYLPFELFRLLAQRPNFNLFSDPNPFQPLTSALPPTIHPDQVCKGKPIYFYANGSKTNNTPPTSTATTLQPPSLLALSLRSCANLPDLPSIAAWFASPNGPANLALPVSMAQEAIAYGDPECTVCGRAFIVPRVEWLEWRALPGRIGGGEELAEGRWREVAIPWMRRGCSWACVEEIDCA
jgi:Leucine Rich repeats (2 copies)